MGAKVHFFSRNKGLEPLVTNPLVALLYIVNLKYAFDSQDLMEQPWYGPV